MILLLCKRRKNTWILIGAYGRGRPNTVCHDPSLPRTQQKLFCFKSHLCFLGRWGFFRTGHAGQQPLSTLCFPPYPFDALWWDIINTSGFPLHNCYETATGGVSQWSKNPWGTVLPREVGWNVVWQRTVPPPLWRALAPSPLLTQWKSVKALTYLFPVEWWAGNTESKLEAFPVLDGRNPYRVEYGPWQLWGGSNSFNENCIKH